MRLLVTNTAAPQAYTVIRALRPYADLVVATVSGKRPLGVWPTCSAAYSRLVDRRYRVPSPEPDWHEGRVSAQNTAREQAFIDAILDVCRRERIDTIFPSEDAWVYVLSKNKKLLERHGVLVPVPDYEAAINLLDKYRTIRCAEEVGFSAPRSYLPSSDADVIAITRHLDPPWVVKPRFTSGGRGMAIVETVDELRRHTRAIQLRHSMPIIQEYIPGRGAQMFYLVVDHGGRAWSIFTPTVVRTDGRVARNSTGACISAPPHPLSEQAVRLVSHMGWWGGATVQTKRDARDGQLKLMEVNPRLGRNLWYRTELGINGPLLCLKIARNEPYEPAGDFALGCLFLDPIEDSVRFLAALLDLAAYRMRRVMGRRASIDPLGPPDTLGQVLRAYRDQYLGKTERRYFTHFKHALTDPLPAVIWTSKVLAKHSVRKMRGLGR